MSQLRWDPTLSEWVIYAPWRQERTFLPPDSWCPLCPTHDARFPTEVPFPSYEIVVFENRFPSLSLGAPAHDGDTALPALLDATPDRMLISERPGYGVCEVVLYTDQHTTTLARLDEERIRRLIAVWADRYTELGALPDVRYVFIFENKGEVIGATLQHPHGQIYAYPFIPPRPARELEAAHAYAAANHGECLHCDLLAREQADGRRVVARNASFTAFVPYSAHFPYEVHLYANRCAASIAQLDTTERADLAALLKQVLSAYDALWDFSMPYVMGMHQAPTDGEDYSGIAHLHIEFYPPHRSNERLKHLAGSELGAGSFIVDVLPEAAAAALREALARRADGPER